MNFILIFISFATLITMILVAKSFDLSKGSRGPFRVHGPLETCLIHVHRLDRYNFFFVISHKLWPRYLLISNR